MIAVVIVVSMYSLPLKGHVVIAIIIEFCKCDQSPFVMASATFRLATLLSGLQYVCGQINRERVHNASTLDTVVLTF